MADYDRRGGGGYNPKKRRYRGKYSSPVFPTPMIMFVSASLFAWFHVQLLP